jgi:hypothetical protein
VRARAAERGLRRLTRSRGLFRAANAFRAHFGPVDGPMLIAAAAAVLGHRSDAYVWLLERARAEAVGLDIRELCQAKHWPRSTFYERTRLAAERVALYLNEHR